MGDGKTELALSLKLFGDPESLRRSITAGQEALEVYESTGMSELAADATAEIEATRGLLRAEERRRSGITAPADDPLQSENSGVMER